MKTKLIKLMLCAMALLPMGAWADDLTLISFTVKSTTTLDKTSDETWTDCSSDSGSPGGTCSFFYKENKSDIRQYGTNYAYSLGGGLASIRLVLTSGTFQSGDIVSVTFRSKGTGDAGAYVVRNTKQSATNEIKSDDYTGTTYTAKTVSLNENFTSNTIYIELPSGYSVFYVSSISVTRPEFTVTLDDNGGSADGAATVFWGDASLTISSAPTYIGYSVEGYYTAASEGTKVANADGTLIGNVDGYTDSAGKWAKAANTTLYAQWTLYTAASITIGSTGYATFANTTEYTLDVPEHLTAYGVSGFTTTGVTFTKYNVIPAGVGVILKADDGYESKSYDFYITETASTYTANNFLVPVTAAKVVPATEYTNAQSISAIQNYIFANKSEGVGFYKSSGSGEISVGKAYLSIPNPAQTTRTWQFKDKDGVWSTTTMTNISNDGTNWTLNTGTAPIARYVYSKALVNEEIYANNTIISETQGLTFTAGSNKFYIDNRETECIQLSTASTKVTIPGLIKNSTVVITGRTNTSGTAMNMVCEDKTNVTKTSGSSSTAEQDHTFTIGKSALSYTFVPDGTKGVNIYKITVTPPATVSGAREFLGFDGLESETTAIEQLEAKTVVDTEAWYTLQGVRVAQPSKGIYIHNGKKVFVK